MLCLLCLSLVADTPPAKILFLGDSITFAGHYVDHVDHTLRLHAAEANQTAPEIIQIGLSSETVCGLTEPGHPFPRPNVHFRLSRALEQIEPDVVFVCYGMNDGIYQPLSEKRFACYRDGLRKLAREVLDHGAELVLLTPPPFDAKGRTDNGKPLVTAAEQQAGTVGLFEGYDDVLAKYAAFVLSLPSEEEFQDRSVSAIDLRTPMLQATAKGRESNPTFTLAADGIHPGQPGHLLMGEAILRGRQAPPTRPDLESDAGRRVRALVRQRNTLLRNAWLSHIGHQHPRDFGNQPIAEATAEAMALSEKISEQLQPVANPKPAPAL